VSESFPTFVKVLESNSSSGKVNDTCETPTGNASAR
jgi:hypothetical protein